MSIFKDKKTRNDILLAAAVLVAAGGIWLFSALNAWRVFWICISFDEEYLDSNLMSCLQQFSCGDFKLFGIT